MSIDSRPVIIVSGLARCGTSLTMQMLHSCGLRCAGEYPAFEAPETETVGRGSIRPEWLLQFDAVKVLDPHRAPFPGINAMVIWLDRDIYQQASSQVKFVKATSWFDVPASARKSIAKSLKRERPLAISQFKGMPKLFLNFKDAIANPMMFAQSICDFLGPAWNLEADKMAACVLPRKNGSMCEPDLAIEYQLLGDRA